MEANSCNLRQLFIPLFISERAMEGARKAYARLGFEGRELPRNIAYSGNAWVLEAKHKGMELM